MRQVKMALATTAVLAALVGIGTGASAQPGGGMGSGGPGMGQGKGMTDCKKGFGHRKGHGMGPGAKLDKMTVHLGLTAEQRYKILPILDDQFKEMKAVRADDNLTRAQTRAKMLAIRDKSFERMKPILTPEQQKKADEMKTRMAEKCKFRQEKMGQQSPAPQK